jgi:hypothetical protein
MIERMVLFGASGDLTSRLLMPAVAQLAEAGLMPPGFTILGSANTDWSTDDFRHHIAAELDKHAPAPAATGDAVVRMLTFQPADVTRPQDVSQLIGADHPATLVYLALPPFLLQSVLPALAAAGLDGADAVAIEKPFGTDLASARQLNEILRIQVPEPTIFRIDHFLSNELVRRVLALRFVNRVFEPTWNAVHVDRVDISWLESLTLEGRASYYDGTGALKDMVQNHLMEAMALVLMEQPARVDAHSFRGVRVEGLRAVRTPTTERMRRDTVRARYTAGTIGTRHVPSYVDEPGVHPGRGTETYACLTLQVDNPQVGRGSFHPGVRQGPAGGFRGDRHPLPPAPPLPARSVARHRAERPADRSRGTLRAAVHHAQWPGADSRDPPARGPLHAAAVHRLRPPDPGDDARRPDAFHPRRRSRRILAHHRPCHAGVVSRTCPDPGLPRRNSTAGTSQLTSHEKRERRMITEGRVKRMLFASKPRNASRPHGLP